MSSTVFLSHHQFGLRIIDAYPSSKRLPGFGFAIGITLFFLIFEIWDLIVVFDNLEMLMSNLVSTVGVCLCLLKMVTCRLKCKKLKHILNIVLRDCTVKSDENTSEIIIANCTRFQIVSKMIIFLYNAMNFTYFLSTIISYCFDAVEDRKFLTQVTFPFDGRKSPFYEILISLQFVIATMCFNSQALIEGLLATLVLHACSKADIVCKEILHFSKICKSNSSDKKIILLALRKLFNKHSEFIYFFNNTQNIYVYVSFFHIFFLTLLQVFSMYMFLITLKSGTKFIDLIHYITLTLSFLVSSGYYCIFGEYLTTQGEKIFKSFLNCPWYEFSTSVQKSINFMLIKARKPVYLTVGKFSNLSLTYFTSITKTSFSYLSLVRAVR